MINMGNDKDKSDKKEDETDLSLLIGKYVENDKDFTDSFLTSEQRKRDTYITLLLEKYVDAYKNKIKTQKKYRQTIFGFCIMACTFFTFGLIAVLLYIMFMPNSIYIEELVSLVSIIATFAVSILALIKIITEYCFPKNDEEYITSIVKCIQENDLRHKIVNINNTKGKKHRYVFVRR